MAEMTIPMSVPLPVQPYFAIYTLEDGPARPAVRGVNWDLHATATDRSMAISHARMLAMQPGVREVHVKEVTENPKSGLIRVRNVTRCRRGHFLDFLRHPAGWPIAALCAGFAAALGLIL